MSLSEEGKGIGRLFMGFGNFWLGFENDLLRFLYGESSKGGSISTFKFGKYLEEEKVGFYHWFIKTKSKMKIASNFFLSLSFPSPPILWIPNFALFSPFDFY